MLAVASGLKADFSLGYLTVMLGFIPLYIGRLMNSSKAAIIASFLLFMVMNGTVGDFSLWNNITLPIILFAVSLICAFLVVRNIEKKDIN
jgi:hypothetical protein